jgi:hypothetical protein
MGLDNLWLPDLRARLEAGITAVARGQQDKNTVSNLGLGVGVWGLSPLVRVGLHETGSRGCGVEWVKDGSRHPASERDC